MPKKPSDDSICITISSTFRPSEAASIRHQAPQGKRGPFIRKAVLRELKRNGFKPVTAEK